MSKALNKNFLTNLTIRGRLGFTLVELLIVIAINSVILFIVVPTYNSVVKDKRKLQGETYLLDLRQKQERYFSSNISYTLDLAQLGYSTPAPDANEIYYNVIARNCTGVALTQCVEIVAQPRVAGDSTLIMNTVSDEINETPAP